MPQQTIPSLTSLTKSKKLPQNYLIPPTPTQTIQPRRTNQPNWSKLSADLSNPIWNDIAKVAAHSLALTYIRDPSAQQRHHRMRAHKRIRDKDTVCRWTWRPGQRLPGLRQPGDTIWFDIFFRSRTRLQKERRPRDAWVVICTWRESLRI